MNQRATAAIEGAIDGRIGTTIDGRYVVERKIAVGGRGLVYLGRDRRLGTRVAIKVLHDELTRDPRVVSRFRSEVQTTSSLGHLHIVRVLDTGELADGATYLVLEYLEGNELSRVLASEGALPVARAVVIARQLCEALVAAHSVGLVHRDLENESVFLVDVPEGEEDFVKVLDFGVATLLGSEGTTSLDAEATSRVHSMSPEQAAGRRVDHRSDVYQVGAILYEMLTGRPPFEGDSMVTLLVQKTTLEVPRPRLFRPELPWILEEIVLRALAREPSRRFASMRQLRDALARLALPDSPTSGIRARPRRISDRPPAVLETNGLAGDDAFPEPELQPRISSNPPPRISSNPPRISSNPPRISSNPPSIIASPPRTVSEPASRRSSAPPRRIDPRLVRVAIGLLAIGAAAAIVGVVGRSSIHAPGRGALQGAAHLAAPSTTSALGGVRLSLRSSPPGAFVVVGERTFGPTPTDVRWNAPGMRPEAALTLRFVHPGYDDRTVTRVIAEDGSLSIDVSLAPSHSGR